MSSYVSAELRRLVIQRAEGLCEYCLIHEFDTYLGCQVDHIISEKHDGATALENLAYACVYCNRAKGTDIGSRTRANTFCRFFNPRVDEWADHFELNEIRIGPRSDIGEVTSRILDFNSAARLLERQLLWDAGRFPAGAALSRIGKIV